jgi:hypothetical protein
VFLTFSRRPIAYAFFYAYAFFPSHVLKNDLKAPGTAPPCFEIGKIRNPNIRLSPPHIRQTTKSDLKTINRGQSCLSLKFLRETL